MTDDSLILFEIVNAKPMPYLPDAGEAADGTRLITLQQCVERFGRAEADWRDEWTHLYGRWLPKEGGTITPQVVEQAHAAIRSNAIHAAKFAHLSREQFEYVESVAKISGYAADQLYAKVETDDETKMSEVILIMPIALIRAQADATGTRGTEQLPEFCGADGKWMPSPWTSEEPPVAARVKITRTDTGEEKEGIAYFSQCAQYERKGGKSQLMPQWQGNRAGPQLGKCASADVHRRTWPKNCGRFRIPEEAGVPTAIKPTPMNAAAEEVPSLPGDAHSFVAARNPQPTLATIMDEPRLLHDIDIDDDSLPDFRRLPYELYDLGAAETYAAACELANSWRLKLPRIFRMGERAFSAVLLRHYRNLLAPA